MVQCSTPVHGTQMASILTQERLMKWKVSYKPDGCGCADATGGRGCDDESCVGVRDKCWISISSANWCSPTVGLFKAITTNSQVGSGSMPLSHSFKMRRKHLEGLPRYLVSMRSRMGTFSPSSNPRLYQLVVTAWSFLCTSIKSLSFSWSENSIAKS